LVRTFLRLGVFLVLLLAVGCSSNNAPTAPLLVGAWRSSIQFEAGAFAEIKDLEFLYAFHSDGTLTESSNHDAAPPVPPAYGVWRAVGPNEFEARYEFYTTKPSDPEALRNGAGWIPSGRGVLTERIKLSDDANTFTSSLTYEPLDPGGRSVAGGGSGTGRAVRIRLEPTSAN